MNSKIEAVADNNIVLLTQEEVQAISGGAGPAAPIIAGVKACAKNTTCSNTVKAGALAVAGAIAAFVGYENNKV